MSSSDADALRQLLAKRTEEVREARAALDATNGALVNQRQTLKGLLMRAEALVPERKAVPRVEAGVDAWQPRVLAETGEVVGRLASILGVLEAENESKVAGEKRRAELFLAELRSVRGEEKTEKTTRLELEATKAELGETQRRLAAYEVWEKELGSLQEVKTHLLSEISSVERKIAHVTGQPAVRNVRFHLRVHDQVSSGEVSHLRLISGSGEELDAEKVKRVVVKTSEVLTCRVCLTRPVQSITFPCMHLALCGECARAGAASCCLCGVPVTGQVEARLADELTEFLALAEEISGSALLAVDH